MPDENEFREWMDRLGLKAEDVAPKLGVSAQTVSHWRSQGVPERRQAHVAFMMQSWAEQSGKPAAETPLLQPFILQPTPEQFRRWNQAAISGDKPMLIEDWIKQSLDQLAAEWEQEQATAAKNFSVLPMVAEEEAAYQAKTSNGN